MLANQNIVMISEFQKNKREVLQGQNRVTYWKAAANGSLMGVTWVGIQTILGGDQGQPIETRTNWNCLPHSDVANYSASNYIYPMLINSQPVNCTPAPVLSKGRLLAYHLRLQHVTAPHSYIKCDFFIGRFTSSSHLYHNAVGSVVILSLNYIMNLYVFSLKITQTQKYKG